MVSLVSIYWLVAASDHIKSDLVTDLNEVVDKLLSLDAGVSSGDANHLEVFEAASVSYLRRKRPILRKSGRFISDALRCHRKLFFGCCCRGKQKKVAGTNLMQKIEKLDLCR